MGFEDSDKLKKEKWEVSFTVIYKIEKWSRKKAYAHFLDGRGWSEQDFYGLVMTCSCHNRKKRAIPERKLLSLW